MMIHGSFQVAVRGPMRILRQLPELPQKWFDGPLPDKTRLVKGGMKSAEKNIAWRLKQLKETNPEEIAVLSWHDSVDVATTYMDMLEYMAQCFPELDVAVGVETSNSISGGSHHSSYYSHSGEKTLDPDDFGNVCSVEIIDSPHLIATGRDGKKRDLVFADYPDFYDYDTSLLRNNLFDVCIENHPWVFVYTPSEDKWDFVCYFNDEDEWDSEGKTEETNEHKIERLMPDYEKLFLVDWEGKVQTDGYTDDLLKQIMKIIFPQETFHVETMDGIPLIWDNNGREYFLGSVMEYVESDVCENVDWGFPDEEEGDPWVPFN